MKTVGRWDTKAVIVTQVRPTDSGKVNLKKKKREKANQNHENLPVFPLIQGLPISNLRLHTSLLIKMSTQKYRSVRGAFSFEKNI